MMLSSSCGRKLSGYDTDDTKWKCVCVCAYKRCNCKSVLSLKKEEIGELYLPVFSFICVLAYCSMKQ